MSTGPTVGREAGSSAETPSATTGNASVAAIETTAEPTAVTERPDGTTEVAVHLVARDKEGRLLNDGNGRHVYEFERDLVRRMSIEE
jgi:hypothetical protein